MFLITDYLVACHNRTDTFIGEHRLLSVQREEMISCDGLQVDDTVEANFKVLSHISGGTQTSVTIAGASTQTEVPINAN
jgi:hypothetical protein